MEQFDGERQRYTSSFLSKTIINVCLCTLSFFWRCSRTTISLYYYIYYYCLLCS